MSKKQRSKKPTRVRPDPAWIRARRRLLREVQSEVRERMGREPNDVKVFRRRYELELSRPWTISNKAHLLKDVEAADIVYGGDFHALSQSQRTHLKILRALETKRPVILALECFGRDAQKELDLFLAGRIDIDQLKKKTRWDRTWGFPWDGYRALLELAKRRGFKLLALNEPFKSRLHHDLEVREKRAAEIVRASRLKLSQSLVYVVFGDLHIADRHLPRWVRKGLRGTEKPREVSIHINSEKIYFELAKKGLELTTDVVKFGPGRYCVMSSPPWVQWQSYLLFLERTIDSGLARDDDDDEFDPTDQVANLVKLVSQDLRLPLKTDHLTVYAPDDERVWSSLEKNLKAKEREIARELLAGGQSFYLPGPGIGYLARETVNHAAALAGHYVHSRLCGRRRILADMPADFPALIWSHAVSYFVSKLINHKRQTESLNDLRASLALAGPGDHGREAMRLALDRFMSEVVWINEGRRRVPVVRARRKSSYFEAARILGGMMGERLYMAHRSRKLSREEIIHFLSRDVTRKSFARDYDEILHRLSETGGAGIESRRERL